MSPRPVCPSVLLVAAVLATPILPRMAHAYPVVLDQPARYVIITPDLLAPSFAPLVEWKNEKGVPALVRTMSQVVAAHPVAADDAERVRMEIQDAYAAGAKWILLGGDVGVMPVRIAHTTFYGGYDIPTDLYFQCLDRNWNADGDGLWGEGYVSASDPGDDADLVPEVWVGRALVASPADVDLFVAKTLQYERDPAGDYEQRTLCFADVLFPQNWMPGDFISLDGAELIEENLPTFDLRPSLQVERYYENFAAPGYRPGALEETHAAVVGTLNDGRNLVLGVGSTPASETLSLGQSMPLTSADALALTNGARLSVWFSPSLPNALDLAPAPIARALVQAPLGGAAAVVAMSAFDFPTASRVYRSEFLKLALRDSVKAVGEALSRARLPYVTFSNFDGVNRWVQMSLLLLGDPELQLYTGPLRALDVTYPPVAFIESGYIEATVRTGGVPLAGATVAAYDPGVFIQAQVTDANGFVHIPLPANLPARVHLTVTACDARPFRGEFDYTFFPLATELSLASIDATAERVRLVWQSGATPPASATLERTEDGDAWRGLEEQAPDGSGRFTFEDHAIRPGARYGYRLFYRDEEGEGRTAASWIDVPARAALAMHGARPNPAHGGLTLAFSLATPGPARIELLDLAGRLLETREVGELGPGEHLLRLEISRAWRPGVYVVRLTQGDRRETRRVTLMR